MFLEGDLHLHTIASGHGFSTVKEIAGVAAKRGIKIIGITDHGLNMPGGPHLYYFRQLLGLPRVIEGVEVLRGVEANIIDTAGNLDMPEGLLAKLDLVLAGFHEECGYSGSSVEENTAAMIAAIHNPFVHIITHPGNPVFPVDIEKVVIAACHAKKALEINNNSFCLSRSGSAPNCTIFAKEIKKHNALLSINSDSHFCDTVGQCQYAMELINMTGINDEPILNTSALRIKEYIGKKS
ncbi:putative phosphatase YcdX [Pelotomaculum sp. FP]|uniref:PHP domain-containing protein n=1 Tax=Pelotomaculum sp. FP TaxID=261474 RepID=UPI001066BC4E|nr:PHP domain-containing protein [Pelotomaculum sp. FP]TEB17005.1 putative phosphatase YcdX [Pelotomaculum sp. FP]